VRWVTSDEQRVRALLSVALGIRVLPGQTVVIGGLRLLVSRAQSGLRPHGFDRLEIGGSAEATGDDPASGAVAARFVAVGWATVDLDRTAAAWPATGWLGAPRDALVGARVLLSGPGWADHDVAGAEVAGVGMLAHARVRVALLEPDTEGRLAAALARHGEGPAVVYAGLSSADVGAAGRRLAAPGGPLATGTGPFGTGLAIAGPQAWSPTLILVAAWGGDASPGPAGGRRGTIRP
jgi:hypothetical protein